jgi:hypothetical protein
MVSENASEMVVFRCVLPLCISYRPKSLYLKKIINFYFQMIDCNRDMVPSIEMGFNHLNRVT